MDDDEVLASVREGWVYIGGHADWRVCDRCDFIIRDDDKWCEFEGFEVFYVCQSCMQNGGRPKGQIRKPMAIGPKIKVSR